MMTSSGFLSPCREGKMADSKTPHIVPEPEEKRPPPPALVPVAALPPSVKRQLETGKEIGGGLVSSGGNVADKRPKVATGKCANGWLDITFSDVLVALPFFS
jgi:hypothetical protein